MSPRPAVTVVALGSTRKPKVRAVRRALSTLTEHYPDFVDRDFRLITRRVASGTAPTPRSTAELMAGARHRAQLLFDRLRSEGDAANLSLGLEGGVVSESVSGGGERFYLLESWAFATDGVRGTFGSSGCLPLPVSVVEAVMERGEDLGRAADRLFGQQDVAGRQGTFGVLTGEIITREDAFVRSLLHALAPFYNHRAYGDSQFLGS